MLTARAYSLFAAALVALVLALPSPAAAGTYTVSQCSQATSPTPGQAVGQSNDAGFSLSQSCSSGGGLRVGRNVLSSSPANTYGRWTWSAPAGTTLIGVQANATLVDGSGVQARLTAVGANGQLTTVGSPAGSFAPFAATGEFTGFRAGLACPGPSACAAGGTPSVAVRDVLLQLDDRSAPTAAFAGGSLLASDGVRGAQALRMSANDAGGGVRRIELRINDQLVSDQILDCRVSGNLAAALQPCPGQPEVTADLATSEAPFSTGVNQLTMCASDLAVAGQPNRGCANAQVFVDDLCPTSSVSAGSKLTARFAGGGKSVRLRSNKKAAIIGKLTTDSGDGIGGAKVCALTRIDTPAEPYRVADVAKTRGDGSYRLRLSPGANREVVVDRALNGAVLMSKPLQTRSAVRPSFEIKPGGKGEVDTGARLRFRGKLPGPACAGRIVKVQAKVGKRRWQVFRGIRTNESCVYKTRFKLRATSERTRYLFRARVPEQPDYPYAAGSSTVRARVAGPA